MNHPPYKPVEGKTYSLFADVASSNDFFRESDQLLDFCLELVQSPEVLLHYIQEASSRKKYRVPHGPDGYREFLDHFRHSVPNRLIKYTSHVQEHLDGLSLMSFWEKTLHTTEWQYHLYIIEIALVNRINKQSFRESAGRIALLPHCLRDLSGNCKASKTELEYECRNCSRDCFIGHTSILLKRHGVQPYIWMSGGLKSLIRAVGKEKGSVGVLGIACIPELVAGMRRCMKAGVPVIGLPLNANRCIRWMGAFHENSLNLEKLEHLLK